MLEYEKIVGMKGSLYLLIDLTKNECDSLINVREELKKINDNALDGFVILEESANALFKTTIYNKDLGFCEISGNAIIALIRYLYNNNRIKTNNFLIETPSGLREIDIVVNGSELKNIIINMGKPILNPQKIPVKTEKNIFINENLNMDGCNFNTTCLSIGNPHAVIISENIDKINLQDFGPKIEFNHIFPRRTNIELTELLNNETVYNRIWERGNGEVPICITGSCASVVALTLNNYLKQNQDIKVTSKGGTLIVNYKNNEDVIVKVKNK